MTWLLALVPLGPLIAALAVAVLHRGRHADPPDSRRAGWPVVAGCAASLVCLLALGPPPSDAPLDIHIVWARVGIYDLTLGLLLDGLSWTTAVMVAAVALIVNTYAVAHMADEPARPRFFTWMGVFAGAMLALVLAGSFVLLFAAWELVGLASYALIRFHHRSPEARRAANKAFLVTRLGDMGLLLGWLLALVWLGTTDIAALTTLAEGGAAPAALVSVLAFLMLIAALGKSAQLPLTMWLPDAMIGPTPVSALIHSATMVAAGVYLILRVFPVFAAAPAALELLTWLGVITALWAALVATAQRDLKRILAWSTVSQLGEMMLALGLAAPAAALHHLLAHAVFKSGLFLGAGAVERTTGAHELARMGGLGRRMPWITGGFAICALALAGVPPLAGFYSEEALLGSAVARGAGWGVAMVILMLLAGLYVGRAAVAVFASWPGAARPHATPARPMERVPLWILAVAALAGGWAVEPLVADVIASAWPASPGWGWTAAAALAGVIGLVAATLRVQRSGPEPALGALGSWPRAMARALDTATYAPARAAQAVARGLSRVEAALDRGARALAAGTRTSARGVNTSEHGLDTAARRSARATVAMAGAVDTAEARGFSAGGDDLARGLSRAGQGLRELEVGKVYLYAMALFAWVLLASIAAVALWLT